MPDMIYRILDANGNRAREAARVLEEHARFGWEDATLSAEWKRFRHDLSAAAQLLDERAMIAARDTPGDVGTHITTDQETQRHSGGDVVRAAAKRLGEALRTLEEYGKPIHVEYAGRIETLRYAAYDLEKRMMRRLSVRQNFAHVRLYVLITEALCRRDWMSTAREAIAGGADGLQLREKNLDGSEMVRRATRLSQLCHDHGVLFIVNDRPDVAVLSHADGVHVGQDDLTVQQARRIIGADLLIGKSTHSIAQAQAAAKEGPDYIAVGPMFESTTKTQSGLAGPKTLAAVMKDTTLPIVAIGGIKATNVREILDTGCERAAVCSEVISADDVRSATRVLKEALVQGR